MALPRMMMDEGTDTVKVAYRDNYTRQVTMIERDRLINDAEPRRGGTADWDRSVALVSLLKM